MPFQYRPYQNQYVGSITDLMGRGRDAEAQALIDSANAQAQAARVSGQAWGGAVQGIGNTIAAIPGQIQAQQDRDRVMEQRERDDQARELRAETYAPPTIGSSILPGTPSRMKEYPPSETAVPFYEEGTPSQPVMRPTLPTSETYGPGMIDPYRTEDANGSNIFDLEQIIAAFASAGLDPPDMSPYIAINQEITGRFDQSLLNARGVARTLLEGPSGAWEQGLRTSLGVYEANGLLPAPMLASMRAQLEDIASLPPEEKEARLGQLLHQLTGDAAPEPVIARPGSVRSERQYPGGPETITTLGEPELTEQERAHEAYARSLYPDHEGPNARSLLTDADRLAYDKRQAEQGRGPGSVVWERTGGMIRDDDGNFVPALDAQGNQIQPRETSASQGMPSTEWGLIVAASDPAHPRHQQAIDALALKSERDRDRPPTASAILSAEMQMEGKFRSEMTSHREIERQFNIMRTGLQSLDDQGLELLLEPMAGGQSPEFGEDGFLIPGGARHQVKNPSANAASQAILVTFQKILDPDSVVRESEYARSAQGVRLMDRIKGEWMRITRGGAGVPVSELRAFVALASHWVDASRESATRIKNLTSDAATRMHLNPENITYSYDERWGPTSDDAQGDSARQSF